MKIIRIIGVTIGLVGIAAGILAGYRRRKKRYATGGF
jgi:hypothetical protein